MLWAQLVHGYKHLTNEALFLTLVNCGRKGRASDSHIDHISDLTQVGIYFRSLKYRLDLVPSGIVFDELLFLIKGSKTPTFFFLSLAGRFC